jgi:hypothetical protein
MDPGKRKSGLYFTPRPDFLEARISNKSHSHLKIESGGKRFFCGIDSTWSYEGLMIRELIKQVLHERPYFPLFSAENKEPQRQKTKVSDLALTQFLSNVYSESKMGGEYYITDA